VLKTAEAPTVRPIAAVLEADSYASFELLERRSLGKIVKNDLEDLYDLFARA
jgi:hypothetical protein